MLFKKLFGSADKTAMASRKSLAALSSEIAQARGKVAQAEDRVSRLQTIAAEEATAARALQAATEDDHGVGLELYASGRDTPIAGLVTAADAAAKAAAVARAALPAAQNALANSKDVVVQLEGRKRTLVSEALIEHGDILAVKYRAKFIELGALYDELLAFAQGTGAAGYADVRMLDSYALEVPKFKLPAMNPPTPFRKEATFSRHGLASDNLGYTTFLRHEVDTRQVEANAEVWTQLASELCADPGADVTNLPAFVEPSLAPGDRKRGGLIIHKPRQHDEPSLLDAGLIPGPSSGRWIG